MLPTGDEAQQVVRMGADVSHDQRRTATCRVFFPGLAASAGLGPPALHILHLHQTDVAQLPGHHHGLGLAYQRIAGVVVRQAKDQSRGLHPRVQRFGLCQRVGHGFVANNVHATGQRLHGERKMAVVGRHDGHNFCAIGALRFGINQSLAAGVAAVLRHTNALTRAQCPRGVGRQRCGH
jgi:hypothetical protein